MDKLLKTKLIAHIVYNAIWLVLAIPFYFAGLSKFQETGGFIGWMLWGAGCSILIISFLIKLVFNQAKEGAKDGANNADDAKDENHPGCEVHVAHFNNGAGFQQSVHGADGQNNSYDSDDHGSEISDALLGGICFSHTHEGYDGTCQEALADQGGQERKTQTKIIIRESGGLAVFRYTRIDPKETGKYIANQSYVVEQLGNVVTNVQDSLQIVCLLRRRLHDGSRGGLCTGAAIGTGGCLISNRGSAIFAEHI